MSAPEPLVARLERAGRALVIGIGGGGDVVGSLAIARRLDEAGVEFVLGGVAWERFVVDPYPGPRPQADLDGAELIGETAALAHPGRPVTTPEGAPFSESRIADFAGDQTVLIDVTRGAPGAAAGIEAAAERLGCDTVVLVDIGGDAIAEGSEPGLASPLCDAVMIAAGAKLAERMQVLLVVLGAGCDGELEPHEVSRRVAALASTGGWLGAWGVGPEAADEIERAAEVAITEASLLVARAAKGVIGGVEIRGGRRTVDLGPLAAIGFIFDVSLALAELPLVRAVADAPGIHAARDALAAIGVRTELDYELDRAAEAD